jgi:hypothetical protein
VPWLQYTAQKSLQSVALMLMEQLLPAELPHRTCQALNHVLQHQLPAAAFAAAAVAAATTLAGSGAELVMPGPVAISAVAAAAAAAVGAGGNAPLACLLEPGVGSLLVAWLLVPLNGARSATCNTDMQR